VQQAGIARIEAGDLQGKMGASVTLVCDRRQKARIGENWLQWGLCGPLSGCSLDRLFAQFIRQLHVHGDRAGG